MDVSDKSKNEENAFVVKSSLATAIFRFFDSIVSLSESLSVGSSYTKNVELSTTSASISASSQLSLFCALTKVVSSFVVEGSDLPDWNNCTFCLFSERVGEIEFDNDAAKQRTGAEDTSLLDKTSLGWISECGAQDFDNVMERSIAFGAEECNALCSD